MQPEKVVSVSHASPSESLRWQQLLREAHLSEEVQASLPRPPDANEKRNPVALIKESLTSLTAPGQVVELRILGVGGKKRIDSGYFNDLDKLARAAAGYDGRAEGIYVTINPVNPALIARASNRVKEYAGQTTTDADIVRRTTLPVDFDPNRPAGISATAAEKEAALVRAWACHLWLKARGWPDPFAGDSGNGAHLQYAIDLANTPENAELVKRCLLALSALFSDDQVEVDTSIGNASRILKLYGTLARKGDNVPDRPHRRAAVLYAPEQRAVVSREQLEALAALAPGSQKPQPSSVSTKINAMTTSTAHSRYAQAAFEQEIAKLASTHKDRNPQLFKSASALFSLVAAGVLDEGEVRQALLSTALSIGLTEIESQRTIQSGARHGFSKPRQLSAETERAPEPREAAGVSTKPETAVPVPTSPAAPVNNQPAKPPVNHLLHVNDLDSLPPIRWLIQDILPEESLVAVYGAPSSGKTQVVFDMAQTLAASGKTVIYVVAEGLRGYRSRKKAWQQFRKQEGGDLYIWKDPVQLFELASVKQFIEAIRPKQPVLVVFDTLSRCSLGADENNQKDMGFILDSLDTVRRETGATVIAVHHSNASGGRERGSTVIRGGMDVMMEVAKEDDLITVSCAKVKDSEEFATVFLKPILVDIGEEKPVPVLVLAEKRVQTQADKLSKLQLDILRAIGMEMFSTSGIKSSQLDEILPPGTKRTSKYTSLNQLIRLGYVEPHAKGDPYLITEAGRLKLSSAENTTLSVKSNMSNPSPDLFLWTLPDACPKSGPVPHTYKCGTDRTWDNRSDEQTKQTNESHSERDVQLRREASGYDEQQTKGTSQSAKGANTNPLRPQTERAAETPAVEDVQPPPMTELDIAAYAEQVGVRYPIQDGDALYRIAELVPLHLRASFEAGLDDQYEPYRAEVRQRGHEPEPKPIPDILPLHLPKMGFISTEQLYFGFQHACRMGQRRVFLEALQTRNTKALEYLRLMVAGHRVQETIVIEHLPKHN